MSNAIKTLLAGGVGALALAAAAPATAQFFPGYGYGAPYRAPNSQVVVNQCASAAQARVGGGYGYGGYSYGGRRVLGISQVSSTIDGGMVVRGVASSGRYAGYGEQRPDLTWRCRTDFRGFITELTVRPAQPNYGYGYNYENNYNYNGNYPQQGNNDYSQYGYQRY